MERLPEDKRYWQVTIDKKLHHRFKLEAVKQSVSMNELVERLIRDYFKGKGGKWQVRPRAGEGGANVR
jgi:hypothetical protein